MSDSKLEKLLGAEVLESISRSTQGWYGPPIPLADAPGVMVNGSGDFVGKLRVGRFSQLQDRLHEAHRRSKSTLGMGFGSAAEFFNARNYGRFQTLAFRKYSPVQFATGANACWQYGANSLEVFESREAAADPGTQFNVDSEGAIKFQQPSTGERMFFCGMEYTADVVPFTILLYDRIWAVRTSVSTGLQSFTGVPERYQSLSPANWDYCGGTFMFPEMTDFSTTASRNWTGQYINQNGDTVSFPVAAGRVNNYIRGLIDLEWSTIQNWFVPLASGDTGVKAIVNVESSVAAAGTFVDWVIGRPIAWMSSVSSLFSSKTEPVMSAFQLRDIHPRACLDMIAFNKPALGGTALRGSLTLVSA